jgi:hypothetical protein
MAATSEQKIRNGSSSTSMSDVYEELGKLYSWEKPKEFSTILDVDFDKSSKWTMTYKIIKQSWVLLSIIALHVVVVPGSIAIAYKWFRQEGIPIGWIAILFAITALLHQFFYGLSSAYSDDLNNGRHLSTETIRRAFRAAIRLLPFSILPGVAIGGIFRRRVPLRMIFNRNGEILFIGRYIHYMMCFVLSQRSSKSFTDRMLDAAKLSVDRRYDVFDVLEGERKRYYLSLALLVIAVSKQEFSFILVIAVINIFISHVGMVWIPTIAADYSKDGRRYDDLPNVPQTMPWKFWFSVSGIIQIVVGVSMVGITIHSIIASKEKSIIAKEEYKQTLMMLPRPSDEMIGKWMYSETGVFTKTDVFDIDRMPEMQCKASSGGYECKRIHSQNMACYNVENYLTKVCLYYGILDEAKLSESVEGRQLLALLKDSGISISDIEFSLLPVSLDKDDGTITPERGGIFRLRDGSESSARYGRDVMILFSSLNMLKRSQ